MALLRKQVGGLICRPTLILSFSLNGRNEKLIQEVLEAV